MSEPQNFALARIALGTAQLGMTYGIANQSGRPSEEQAQALVQSAVSNGLNWFDTAAAYGDSEAVLGRAFAALGIQDRVNVVSKGSSLATDGHTLTTRVNSALRNLGVPRLNTWLLHDENQLFAWDDRTNQEAQSLLKENRVGSFGLSAYHPENALRAVEQYGFTAVQCPASPMDRRFLRSTVTNRLKKSVAQVYIRSVYLQGLCLMDPAQVPAAIFRGREAVKTLTDFCARHGLARDHFCLHYVLQRTSDIGARLVIGMENQAQLAKNLSLLAQPPVTKTCLDEWDALWPDDLEDLVLPFRWNARP